MQQLNIFTLKMTSQGLINANAANTLYKLMQMLSKSKSDYHNINQVLLKTSSRKSCVSKTSFTELKCSTVSDIYVALEGLSYMCSYKTQTVLNNIKTILTSAPPYVQGQKETYDSLNLQWNTCER